MSVYTVHAPPRTGGNASDADRLAFVRDGFAFWAFLVSALWMIWHRMWLVLLIYIAAVVAIAAALRSVGVSDTALVVAGVLISLLVGFEAATLRRFTLRNRGWSNIGLVSGDDLEHAERRFFATWHNNMPVAEAPAPMETPGALAPTAVPVPPPRRPPPAGVIGLFPEPGAKR